MPFIISLRYYIIYSASIIAFLTYGETAEIGRLPERVIQKFMDVFI